MKQSNKIKFAWRNMLRNRRRSLLTMVSVVVGFVALSIFEGYFTTVYKTLEDQAIIGERLGHLTVAKKGYFDKWFLDPEAYMFNKKELEVIQHSLSKDQNIELVSPRLSVSGLVSNGEISRIFIGEGINPEDQAFLRGEKYQDLPGRLDPSSLNSGVLGQKLAQQLALEKGDDAVLMGSTLDGMVNAIDMEISEAFNTGSVGTDDKLVLIPYDLAKKLYHFDGAERVVLVLNSMEDIDSQALKIADTLQRVGLEVEIKRWDQLSLYYGQVRNVFDLMYLFISVVVVIVVVASVINTMGMSISERTREIGTLRALGMKCGELKSLFVYEGMVVVFIGCVIGIVFSYGIGGLINLSEISYTPPDASTEVELTVEIVFSNVFGSLFTFTLLAAIAAYFPARKATQRTIVGALGHV